MSERPFYPKAKRLLMLFANNHMLATSLDDRLVILDCWGDEVLRYGAGRDWPPIGLDPEWMPVPEQERAREEQRG